MASSMRLLVLVLLTIQNSAYSLSIRYSRAVLHEKFLTGTAVLVGECIKLVVSSVLMWWDWSSRSATQPAWDAESQPQRKAVVASSFPPDTVKRMIHLIRTSWKLCVPAAVYFVQNMLTYVALQKLSPSMYTSVIKVKIITTALLSTVLLGRRFSTRKWRALALLLVSVVLIVQTSSNDKSLEAQCDELAAQKSGVVADVQMTTEAEKNAADLFVGIVVVLIIALCSSFAGVYFEKVLKSSPKVSIWERNFQLGFYSIIFGVLRLAIFDMDAVLENGFFYGYSSVTFAVISVGSLGGLLVAAVMKYADNILKGFANSCATIFTMLGGAYFFGNQLSVSFGLSAVALVISLFNYQEPDPQPPAAAAALELVSTNKQG